MQADIAKGQRHSPSMTIAAMAYNDLHNDQWKFVGLTPEVLRDWDEFRIALKSMGRVCLCMTLDPDRLFPPKFGPDRCAADLTVLAQRARSQGLYVIDLCKFTKIYDMSKTSDGWHFQPTPENYAIAAEM